MEVHAHSHTSRKRWTHYFWEFLMLFLAVFCGFLAENQREHMVEHQREKKYMESMYDDLKKDTADYRNDILWWTKVLDRIDTIRFELDKPETERNYLQLYKKAANMRDYNSFEYHDRTIQQLKSAGNFRLIRNPEISDSLIDYDAIVQTALKDQESQSNNIYQQVNFLQDKIIDTKYFNRRSGNLLHMIDSAYMQNPGRFNLSGATRADLFQYYNNLEFYSRITIYRINAMKILNRMAVNIINLIKKVYHLSEETPLEK